MGRWMNLERVAGSVVDFPKLCCRLQLDAVLRPEDFCRSICVYRCHHSAFNFTLYQRNQMFEHSKGCLVLKASSWEDDISCNISLIDCRQPLLLAFFMPCLQAIPDVQAVNRLILEDVFGHTFDVTSFAVIKKSRSGLHIFVADKASMPIYLEFDYPFASRFFATLIHHWLCRTFRDKNSKLRLVMMRRYLAPFPFSHQLVEPAILQEIRATAFFLHKVLSKSPWVSLLHFILARTCRKPITCM